MKRLVIYLALGCALLLQPLSSTEKSKEAGIMANMPKVGDLGA